MRKAIMLTLIFSITGIMITSAALPVIADKDDNPGKAEGCEKANEKSKVSEKNPHCKELPTYFCEGAISGGTIPFNVVVPPGSSCNMRFVTISGSLTADGANQISISNSHIDGDVNIQHATGNSILTHTTVGGDVTFNETQGRSVVYVGITGGTISGDTIYTDNQLAGLYLEGVHVLGNVVITGNFADDEVITNGSTVEGDVLCDGNGGSIFWGSDNFVGGTFSGDCPVF